MECIRCGECEACCFCEEGPDLGVAESSQELLQVTVTFAFCPKNADTWKEEIVEAINRWARRDVCVENAATTDGDALCQMSLSAKRTNDWAHMAAFQCGDGRWMHSDGTIESPEVSA